MAYLDSLRKSLLQGTMKIEQLIEEANIYLEFGYITEEEHHEALAMIHEHFGV